MTTWGQAPHLTSIYQQQQQHQHQKREGDPTMVIEIQWMSVIWIGFVLCCSMGEMKSYLEIVIYLSMKMPLVAAVFVFALHWTLSIVLGLAFFSTSMNHLVTTIKWVDFVIEVTWGIGYVLCIVISICNYYSIHRHSIYWILSVVTKRCCLHWNTLSLASLHVGSLNLKVVLSEKWEDKNDAQNCMSGVHFSEFFSSS